MPNAERLRPAAAGGWLRLRLLLVGADLLLDLRVADLLPLRHGDVRADADQYHAARHRDAQVSRFQAGIDLHLGEAINDGGVALAVGDLDPGREAAAADQPS